jgi:hypothetical protein
MTSNQATVYCFFVRAKGTRYDQYGQNKIFLTDNSAATYTRVIREKIGLPSAEVVLYDQPDWEAPQLQVSSLENDLPAISTDLHVTAAVRKVLTSKGIAEQVIQAVLKLENRDRLHNPSTGLVIFMFKYLGGL